MVYRAGRFWPVESSCRDLGVSKRELSVFVRWHGHVGFAALQIATWETLMDLIAMLFEDRWLVLRCVCVWTHNSGI